MYNCTKHMNKIEVEKVDNGWVLTYWDEYADTGLPYTKKKVFSFDEEEDLEELKALEQLFWEINEQVGVRFSKHNKNNINIEVV